MPGLVWEVTYARLLTLPAFLAEGWEPFAVTWSVSDSYCFWLRRLVIPPQT